MCQNGSTALWHAIWKDRKDVAIHLKEVGADINAQDVVSKIAFVIWNSINHLLKSDCFMLYRMEIVCYIWWQRKGRWSM